MSLIQIQFKEVLANRIRKFTDLLKTDRFKNAGRELIRIADITYDINKESRLYEVFKLLHLTFGTLLYLIGDELHPTEEGELPPVNCDPTPIKRKVEQFMSELLKLLENPDYDAIILKISATSADLFREYEKIF